MADAGPAIVGALPERAGAAAVAGATHLSAPAGDALAPMTPIPYRVTSATRELADVVTLVLEPATDERIAACRPGQFAMLWAFGVGEAPISVSRGVTGHALVHTIRSVGAVTDALCRCGPGDVVGVRGPFGTAWNLEALQRDPAADDAPADVVIVAGGIALAPLRPAIDAVLAARDRLGHVEILVGAREPSDLLFADDRRAWADHADVEVMVTVDRAPRSWKGEVGVVTQLLPRLRADPTRTVALVCGPEIMMRLVADALVDRGTAPEHIAVSLERNMKCAVAQCGHCQLGPLLVCRDGPVIDYRRAAPLLRVRGL